MKHLFLIILWLGLIASVTNADALGWVWAKKADMPAAGSVEGYNVVTDRSGNIYTTGSFVGDTIRFGAAKLTNHVPSGSKNMFLAKFDSSGNFLWARLAEYSVPNAGLSIAIDNADNIYVSGLFSTPRLIFGTDTMRYNLIGSAGFANFFLVKLNTAGVVQWSRNGGGCSNNYYCTVTTDPSGNVAITGTFQAPYMVFGRDTLVNKSINSHGSFNTNVFIAKYNPGGSLIWENSCGTNGINQPNSAGAESYCFSRAITCDRYGNTEIAGTFNTPINSFGRAVLYGTGPDTSFYAYEDNLFIARFDTNGHVFWAKNFPTSYNGGLSANSIITDPAGYTYVTGQFLGDTLYFGESTLVNRGGAGMFFLAKFNTLGYIQWAIKPVKGTGLHCTGNSMVFDTSGKLWISGGFDSILILEKDTLVRRGLSDPPMFVAAYSTAGHLLYANSLAGGGDNINGIYPDLYGNEYVVGDYGNNPFILDRDTLRKTNSEDFFVAKLKVIIPNPGTLDGPLNVCIGDSIRLIPTVPGGTWACTNNTATVRNGVITGHFSGFDTIIYTVTNNYTSVAVYKVLGVYKTPVGGPLIGSAGVCVGQQFTITDPDDGVWTATNGNATVSYGWVTGRHVGVDTIYYTISNPCGIAIKTLTTTVFGLTDAGTVTGPDIVCNGTSITLSDPITGGRWMTIHGHGTVTTRGVVTGVSAGDDSVFYIVPGFCGPDTAKKAISVKPVPSSGVIIGPNTLCVGDSTLFIDTSGVGMWSHRLGHIIDSGGLVKGLSAGTDTILYTVVNAWCSSTSSKPITINPTPFAGVITGVSSFCNGTSIPLIVSVPGGTWSLSNGHAMVVGDSLASVYPGKDTIYYTVTNPLCPAAATKVVTIDSLPDAGVINGPSRVCVNDTISLIDSLKGGLWSALNGNAVIAGSSLATKFIIGRRGGTDTLYYSVTNTCGSAIAEKAININPLPQAGSITGAASLCVHAQTSLTNSGEPGLWMTTNGSARVDTGLVSGLIAGVDTVYYVVANICGYDTALHYITVNALPDSGIILGANSVCADTSIMVTDSVSGGVWSASNGNATVAGGIIRGVNAGIDTIYYSVTNVCRTAIASKTVIINPLPQAGSISGAASVCVGAQITLTDSGEPGIWMTTNGSAMVDTGVISGLIAGGDTVYYVVTNICGIDTASHFITVNPLPDSGSIIGPNSVCADTSILLTDTIVGGVWSASNGNATVAGGIIRGITAGIDTIFYAVTNVCRTAIATKTVVVNPLPVAGFISGASMLCEQDSTRLTDTALGGIWTAANICASITGGWLLGNVEGLDTIYYSVTNMCGTAVATKNVYIHALPHAGIITGPSKVCMGASINLVDTTPGGTWLASNGSGSVVNGTISSVFPGKDTVYYMVGNVCGVDTAKKIVAINQLPDAGNIIGPDSLCVGTIFQMANNASDGVWYSSRGNVAAIDSFTGSIAAISAGTTVITYTILTDTNGCTNATMINVRVLGAPDFSIDSSIRQIRCYGVDDAQIAIIVNGGQGRFSYLWSNGDTTASIANLTTGTYAVNITETATKCSLGDTFIISQPDSFFAIPMIAKEFCKRNDGSIQFQITGGVRPYTYEWMDNNTDSIRLGLVTGDYSVIIADSNKCRLSFNILIEEDTCNVSVYDALTPNGDGINDTWIIDGIQYYPDNLVQIFDKIGDLVYEKSSYNNTWGGEGKNGGALPDGTYYYVIKINTENVKGGHNIQTGAVLIKR